MLRTKVRDGDGSDAILHRQGSKKRAGHEVCNHSMDMIDAWIAHSWLQHAPFLHPPCMYGGMCIQPCALRAVVVFTASIVCGAPTDDASRLPSTALVWQEGNFSVVRRGQATPFTVWRTLSGVATHSDKPPKPQTLNPGRAQRRWLASGEAAYGADGADGRVGSGVQESGVWLRRSRWWRVAPQKEPVL